MEQVKGTLTPGLIALKEQRDEALKDRAELIKCLRNLDDATKPLYDSRHIRGAFRDFDYEMAVGNARALLTRMERTP